MKYAEITTCIERTRNVHEYTASKGGFGVDHNTRGENEGKRGKMRWTRRKCGVDLAGKRMFAFSSVPLAETPCFCNARSLSIVIRCSVYLYISLCPSLAELLLLSVRLVLKHLVSCSLRGMCSQQCVSAAAAAVHASLSFFSPSMLRLSIPTYISVLPSLSLSSRTITSWRSWFLFRRCSSVSFSIHLLVSFPPCPRPADSSISF